jgi:hypothetical protein
LRRLGIADRGIGSAAVEMGGGHATIDPAVQYFRWWLLGRICLRSVRGPIALVRGTGITLAPGSLGLAFE